MNNPNIKDPRLDKRILDAVSVIETRRAAYRSNYFWNVRLQINKIITLGTNSTVVVIKNRRGWSDIKIFQRLFLDSSDKINACFYHLSKLIEEEKWLIKKGLNVAFETEKVNPNPGILCAPLETINYELEAFLFQAYSCLEIFSKAISFIFKDNAGFHSIEKVLSNSNNKMAQKILKVFARKKYSKLINEFKKSGQENINRNRRDYLTHFGMLPICQINVPLNNVSKFPVSMLPSHTNRYDRAIKTRDHIESLFYLLCDFLIEVSEIIFDIEIKPGRKTSNLSRTQHQ